MNGFAWACPHCRAALADEGRLWACTGCDRIYETLRGIPDLRTADDEYLPNRVDWRMARRLAEEYDRRDFLGLLEYYFDLSPDIDLARRRHQIRHILTAPERAGRWLHALRPDASAGLLDLGCGTGSFLVAATPTHPRAIGVDIAMRWLIVARKRLDEQGLDKIPLACGCAERLPIPDGCLDGVVAGDVIEHVRDARLTLSEANRVLRPGGRIFLASPNRYSLTPEPHVHVWGVGYFPRRWMEPYVHLMTGADYRAIRNMGRREWENLLRSSPFRVGRLTVPALPDVDLAGFGPFKRAVARAYNATVTTRPGQWLARRMGPLFHVVCTKPLVRVDLPSIPAIRLHSRPGAAAESTVGTRGTM